MSTVTQNLRYVSLFAAARYHRMMADRGSPRVSWPEHRQRLEALIAVASVRHHREHGDAPLGIVGRTVADRLSEQSEIELRRLVENPPYNIYRGSLGDLGVFDLSQPSDPLFESARTLGEAWSPREAGELGQAIVEGALPATLARATIDQVADAFCLCSIPTGTAEQAELVRLLFAFSDEVTVPTFADDEVVDPISLRSTSWRLLLEIVARSPGRPLGRLATISRLLEPDLIGDTLPVALRPCAFAWRWIAARTIFELGWTRAFTRAVGLVRAAREGLSPGELGDRLREYVEAQPGDEPLAELAADAQTGWLHSDWTAEHWSGYHPRSAMRCLAAGLAAANSDRGVGPAILQTLWGGRGHPVAFAVEYERCQRLIADGRSAADLWEDIGQEALVQHVRASLRKMSQGNPDSRLVDVERGRWIVPGPSALASLPYLAGADSRLDVALRWAAQLGLVTGAGDRWMLTPTGEETRNRWDQEYGTG
jgi:hypothetical protein